ncbi:hypothetical protein AAMO2058_001057800 [Amorphochlora amoebiformis]
MAASIVKMAASTIGMAGAKHDIVLLHGLLSNRKGWGRFPDRLMRALDAEASDSITHKKRATFRLHALDIRNHGDSQHTGTHCLETICEDLTAYLTENDIKNPILMGHSMGGKVALLHTLKHGNSSQDHLKARCVIALDAAPTRYDTNHQYIFRAMQQLDLEKVERRTDASKQLKPYVEHAAERAYILANLKICDMTKTASWIPNLDVLMRDEKKVHDWPLNIEGIQDLTFDGPALFIGGSMSTRLTTPGHVAAVRSQFQNSLIVMVNGGHFVHHAASSDTIEHIVDFLSTELQLRGDGRFSALGLDPLIFGPSFGMTTTFS